MPAIPVTILVGSRDTLTPVARAKDIVERLPNATLEVVPDAGHQLPFERPDLVASILARAAAGAGAALPG
jgi:pimeloyl-ACP methyl ester carboxylesterase